MFEEIDENTVVMVTADHGHVDVGGHGGTEEVVKKIPLILYQKNSNLMHKSSNIKDERFGEGN